MQELVGVKSNLDPTIFIWRTDKTLQSIMCSHADDFFYGGDVDFERDVVERFEVGCEEKISFKYIWVSIRQGGEREMMRHRHYSIGIKELER